MGRGIVLLVLLGVVLAAGFPYFEATRNANERPRILQAMVWLQTGAWAVDGPAVRGLDPGPDVAVSPVDGRLVPNKPPGASLVTAAGLELARLVGPIETLEAGAGTGHGLTLREATWWGRMLTGWLPTLILAGVFLRRYGRVFGLPLASLGVLTWALATPAQSYAHLLYGHALAALGAQAGLVAIAIALAPDNGAAVKLGLAKPDRTRLAWAALGGGLAAAAVAVEYSAVFAALPLGVAVLWGLVRRDRRAAAGVALASALVPIAALAAYHHRVFGSAWATGYQFSPVQEFAAKHAQGLLGLSWPSWSAISTHLLEPGGGLLWWAPATVVGIYGLIQLSWSRDPLALEARLHLGFVAVMLWVVVSLSFGGGWRVGPRYFVIALPSLVLGWVHWWSFARTSALGVGLTLGLTGYAVVINSLAANLWPHFDLDHVRAPVTEVLVPLWKSGYRPYGWAGWIPSFDVAGAMTLAAIALWLLVQVSVVELRARTFAAVGAGIGLTGVLLAAQGLVPRHRDGVGNLDYIRGVWEPRDGSPGRTARLER